MYKTGSQRRPTREQDGKLINGRPGVVAVGCRGQTNRWCYVLMPCPSTRNFDRQHKGTLGFASQRFEGDVCRGGRCLHQTTTAAQNKKDLVVVVVADTIDDDNEDDETCKNTRTTSCPRQLKY